MVCMLYYSYMGCTMYYSYMVCFGSSIRSFTQYKGYGGPPLYGGFPYPLFSLFATTVGAVRADRTKSYKKEKEAEASPR